MNKIIMESKETKLLRKIDKYEVLLKDISKVFVQLSTIKDPDLKKPQVERLTKLQKETEEELQLERQKWNDFIKNERTPKELLKHHSKQNKDQSEKA